MGGQSVAKAAADQKPPPFDVVSVKEDKSDSENTSFNSDPSGIKISGARLGDLIREAYALYESTKDQVLGLPAWSKTERFDIDAKVAEGDIPKLKGLTREQSGEMLRWILVDRFQLTAHRETREMPVYELVIGKHGPMLAANNPDVPSPESSKTSGCRAGCMASDGRHLDAKGVGTEAIAGFLTRRTQRPVIDKTGLTGKYDFSLDWSSEEARESGTTSAPDLFAAIQEQLGLKLQAAKGLARVVVVDRVAEPSAN